MYFCNQVSNVCSSRYQIGSHWESVDIRYTEHNFINQFELLNYFGIFVRHYVLFFLEMDKIMLYGCKTELFVAYRHFYPNRLEIGNVRIGIKFQAMSLCHWFHSLCHFVSFYWLRLVFFFPFFFFSSALFYPFTYVHFISIPFACSHSLFIHPCVPLFFLFSISISTDMM